MTEVTFAALKKTVQVLPYGSAVDEAVRWIEKYNLTKLSIIVKTETSFALDHSQDNIMQTVARLGVALALPLIAKVGVIYNLTAGAARFVIGCVSHIRQENRSETAKEFEAAFVHVLTAAHDFAIGYLLGLKTFGYIISAGLAVFPNQVLTGHHLLFDKAENSEQGDDHWELKDCIIKRTARDFALTLVPNANEKEKSFVQRGWDWVHSFAAFSRKQT